MKIFIYLASISLFTLIVFSSCKKDSFTTAPQIKFEKIDPSYMEFVPGTIITANTIKPLLYLEVTDKEGDVGEKDNKTALLFIKRSTDGTWREFQMPELNTLQQKNFKATVEFDLSSIAACNTTQQYDSLYFDVYIKDEAGNQSNTIRTTKPLVLKCR